MIYLFMLYIIWIEGKMNEIGVEVNGTILENIQNVDVHYWKYNVTVSILDANNILVSGIYKAFCVVFILLSCCCLIIICMIFWQIYCSIFLDVLLRMICISINLKFSFLMKTLVNLMTVMFTLRQKTCIRNT